MRTLSAIIATGILGFVFWKKVIKKGDPNRKSTLKRTFIKAGAPDQMNEHEPSDLENSKMVSEGSQFGVQYFNDFMYD